MKAVKIITLMALATVVILVPLSVYAEEGGSGHYAPGAAASFSDGLPGRPGLAIANFFNFYDGSASASKRLPSGGLLTGGLDATAYSDTIVALYQTPLEMLGGNYAFGVAIPLVWKGFTEGTQKRLAFLPEQATDFIYSVVGEEIGFVGVALSLALFGVLLTLLVRVARRATDPYASLVVFGVAGMLFTHVIENVGMTVGLMPITGIPLPFFSYGGSFLLTCCLALAVALRVSRDSRRAGYGD